MNLSVVILCQNEEVNLPGAIASAAFADEVLIVDGGSTDRSIQISVDAGVRVVERPFDVFAHQRNFGLEQARGTWVMFLDADERITAAAAREIVAATERSDAAAYRIARTSIALGQRLEWHPGGSDEPIRLMQRALARFEGAVHEQCIVDGVVARLAGPIEHRTHRTISALLGKVDRYSTLEATEQVARGARVLPPWRIMWTVTATSWRYWRQGLRKHGMVGAIEAITLGFDRALVGAKIWELHHRAEIDAAYTDGESTRA